MPKPLMREFWTLKSGRGLSKYFFIESDRFYEFKTRGDAAREGKFDYGEQHPRPVRVRVTVEEI